MFFWLKVKAMRLFEWFKWKFVKGWIDLDDLDNWELVKDLPLADFNYVIEQREFDNGAKILFPIDEAQYFFKKGIKTGFEAFNRICTCWAVHNGYDVTEYRVKSEKYIMPVSVMKEENGYRLITYRIGGSLYTTEHGAIVNGIGNEYIDIDERFIKIAKYRKYKGKENAKSKETDKETNGKGKIGSIGEFRT